VTQLTPCSSLSSSTKPVCLTHPMGSTVDDCSELVAKTCNNVETSRVLPRDNLGLISSDYRPQSVATVVEASTSTDDYLVKNVDVVSPLMSLSAGRVLTESSNVDCGIEQLLVCLHE